MSSEPEASNSERADIYRDVITRILKDPAARVAIHIPPELELDNESIEQAVRDLLEMEVATRSRVYALLEFNPTVHAEMSAICTSARRGSALDTGHLYTTTFPCHECTRHIIATGIRRVVYVEPFPKSRAEKLFENQIRLGAKEDAAADTTDSRVSYEPFMGIAPRRQADLFSWVDRSSDPDEIKNWKLDGTKPIRPSIVPLVDERRVALLSQARLDQMRTAIEEFQQDAGTSERRSSA